MRSSSSSSESVSCSNTKFGPLTILAYDLFACGLPLVPPTSSNLPNGFLEWLAFYNSSSFLSFLLLRRSMPASSVEE
ncbi:hypothetical protein PIB30_101588, partial [Stylosanthes scabra]|nr:hypothetical protein [Stylosanthes scabra]